MSIYFFKVKVNLPQGKREIYTRRQSTIEKDGCFNQFCADLLHRYDILTSMVFKITWLDNDGDTIRLVNEDDFLIFIEFKGKEIIVNVREVAENPTACNIISRTNGTYCNTCKDQSREQLNDLRASRNEVSAAEVHENERVEDKCIELNVKLQKLAKDACDVHYPEKQLAAVKEVRILLSSDSTSVQPTIDDLSSSGILQTLVKCLERTDHSMLQLESAWAITNIAAGTFDETYRVVGAGAVPLLIWILASPNSELCAQALWALDNIISDDPNLRDYVIEMGIVEALCKLIDTDPSQSVLIEIAMNIRSLCRSKELPPSNQTIVDIMPALNSLMDHKASEILIHTVWALSHIAFTKEQIQMLIDYGLVPKLILLLGRIEDKLLMATLAVISNITAGSDQQTQVVLNCGALSSCPTLLKHKNEKIRNEVTLVLSNITGGTQSQIQAVIEAGLLPGIISNMKTGEYMTKVNAAWAVSNIAICGNKNQVAQLMKEGAIAPFCRLLVSNDADHLTVFLRGIKNIQKLAGRDIIGHNIIDIIEECNSLERIRELQKHEDIQVMQLAQDIIEELFPYGEDRRPHGKYRKLNST